MIDGILMGVNVTENRRKVFMSLM
uniref:Uncharacterized protein n=1 Tax=Arundo donax TaxID=35708 RepID=A0A0A9H8V2_ARUDO